VGVDRSWVRELRTAPDPTAPQAATVVPATSATKKPIARPLFGALAACTAAVLLWALGDRLWALGRYPGINGDEAWYGVQLLRWSAGEASTWRTPNGNLPGPLHLGLLWGLLEISPRTLGLLRLPTVLSSVAAVVVTFLALRRRFDFETAVLGALFQACIPVGIVYARLGWDPSHGPLLGALALWCALEGSVLLLSALFAFSLWCHPTNVFAAPFLGTVCAASIWEREGLAAAFRQSPWIFFGLAAGLSVLLFASAGVQAFGDASAWSARLLSGETWGHFLAVLGDFLSGAASFAYTAGPPLAHPGTPSAQLLGLGVLSLVVVNACILPRPSRLVVGIVVGFALTLIAFASLAGAHALEPHFERYGLVLVTPFVTLIAILCSRLSDGRLPGGTAWAVGLCVALSALGFTHSGYFSALARTGSLSHETFWTGDEEPKEAAWRKVLAEMPPVGQVRIIADGWWTYQPLTYLAQGTPRVTVSMANDTDSLRPKEVLFLVGFATRTRRDAVKELAPGAVATRWEIPGTNRPDVLEVIRVTRPD